MLIWLRQRPHPQREAAERLYGAIVAQARQSFFYADLGVPDTVDGRFDMILMHAFIVMLRLRESGEESKALSQTLYDVMFVDMDRAIREIGIGDLSVKKHIRRMMKAFNGRLTAYESGLSDPVLLNDAIRRNVYGTVKGDIDPAWLDQMGSYLRHCAETVRAMPVEMMVVGGQMPWAPDLRKSA
jgi:cytochrome b pre-mRNA-processing protein 3